MFKLDRSDLQRIGVAGVGAIILSATVVTAAVGPARAVEANTTASAEALTGALARG